jgi:Aspartyl protease/PDZ domain
MRFPLPARLLTAFAFAATLTPHVAHASITPEAKRVLDRYVHAVGDPASERTEHEVATLTAFGLTGRTESWLQRPNQTASLTELGPFKLREGFDGTAGWRTDPGGKLLVLDGKDLEKAKAAAWFEAELFLLPDQGGGAVAAAGVEKDSLLGPLDVLELTPPVGNSRRYSFDPKTGLPVREVAKNDQQTIVSTLTDYAMIAGRLRPRLTTTEIVGAPANTIRVTLDSVWVNIDIPATQFAAPVENAAPVKYLKTEGIARIPFEYRGKHVWVHASVNGGPPADFIFDTGASITVIDSTYAAKIGLVSEGRQQGQGAGASGGASFTRLQTLRVTAEDGDGVEMTGVQAGVLSVNPFLAPFFWRDAAGVLGFDFINRFVDEIDFDHQVLTLRDPKTFQYAGKGTPIPMTLAGHAPIIQMTLNGKYSGGFRVDVGSSSTVDLHTPFVKKNHLETVGGKGMNVMGGGFGGTFTNRIVRLDKLQLGPFAWTRPIVSLSGAEAGAFTSEDYAGNIGNRLLERFTCTFDYDRRLLYLEPGKRYALPDEFSRAGVQLARTGDLVRAMSVLPNSPAAISGVREGDEVISLDGVPVLTMTPDAVSDVLDRGKAGSVHSLELRRDGKVSKVKVTLKDML